jgi:hypothetical protein
LECLPLITAEVEVVVAAVAAAVETLLLPSLQVEEDKGPYRHMSQQIVEITTAVEVEAEVTGEDLVGAAVVRLKSKSSGEIFATHSVTCKTQF